MTPIEKLVAQMRTVAKAGTYRGLIETAQDESYFRACTRQVPQLGMVVIFTRDAGHHEGGWWKNPEYERCEHLSLSFYDPSTLQADQFNADKARRIAKMFFGVHLKWVWVEPPYTPEGRLRNVHHYRLFCDAGWQSLKPSGEVYSTGKTPAHWKSFSEIHGERARFFSPPIGVA